MENRERTLDSPTDKIMLPLAMPFWHRRPIEGKPGEQQQFVPGCAMGSIRRQECDLQLEYAHHEFLANGRHGLTISEGSGGIYFAALLPDTAFARQIVAAVRSGRIQRVCVHGETRTRRAAEAGLFNVIEYSLFSINLLIASTACVSETWVTVDAGLHQAWRRKNDRQVLGWLHEQLEQGEPATSTSTHDQAPRDHQGQTEPVDYSPVEEHLVRDQ